MKLTNNNTVPYSVGARHNYNRYRRHWPSTTATNKNRQKNHTHNNNVFYNILKNSTFDKGGRIYMTDGRRDRLRQSKIKEVNDRVTLFFVFVFM